MGKSGSRACDPCLKWLSIALSAPRCQQLFDHSKLAGHVCRLQTCNVPLLGDAKGCAGVSVDVQVKSAALYACFRGALNHAANCPHTTQWPID